MSGCPHVDRKNRRCIAAFHLYGPHVYSPIAQVGARKTRQMVDEALFREAVKERTEGICQATLLRRPDGEFVCAPYRHAGDHAHHLFPEDRDVGLHDPGRGVWICWQAHAWIHDNPEAARDLGLLRPSEHAS